MKKAALAAAVTTSLAYLISASSTPDLSSALQNILANTDRSNLYTYPTDLTRDIVPKSIHSHNDYWRTIPFYTALSFGCISTEADVWLFNDTLYVGHETSALTPERTFSSLYIDPILSVLQRQNPSPASSPFVTSPTHNGVFDTSSDQTLYLFVDVKTAGEDTWPFVVQELEPLRSAGYLSRVESDTSTSITMGAVTVIGTGNTPLNLIQGEGVASYPRDYFYDAPLALLGTSFSNITSTVSPIASTDFAASFGDVGFESGASAMFNSTQFSLLKTQIATAHEKGILTRYWDTPAWPISVRNGVWTQLREEGSDLINADDLEDAANGVW